MNKKTSGVVPEQMLEDIQKNNCMCYEGSQTGNSVKTDKPVKIKRIRNGQYTGSLLG
jgi:hypothetical protein